MYNYDKQTNKNTKLHTHWAQGARITSLKTKIRCKKKTVETNLNNAILNSNNDNNNNINPFRPVHFRKLY